MFLLIHRHGLRLLSGLVVALPAHCQEREAVAGQVIDLTGDGVAEAEVSLVHRPIGWCADYGELDVVRAKTDAKGRFRAEVLPARPYSAFASWGPDNAPVVSEVREHTAAGAFVTLVQQQAAIVPVTVRVDGQEKWQDVGPLGFRILPRMAHLWPIPLSHGADGLVALPPLPATSVLFEVVTRDGHTLYATWIAHGAARREVVANQAKDSTVSLQVVRLPAPVDVPVHVVDAASGEPVPGADVSLRSNWFGFRVGFPVLDVADYSRECWRPVGKTDELGMLSVQVPTDRSPWEDAKGRSISLVARAQGYAEAFGGWTHFGPFWDQRTRSENPRPLRIPLHPQRPVTGRLTWNGGQSAAGLSVLLWTEVLAAGGGGNAFWAAPLHATTTDESGSFSFAFAQRGRGPLRIGVALDSPVSRQLLGRARLPTMLLVSPFAEAGVKGASGLDELNRELGEATLGDESATVVHLRDESGNPLRGVQVMRLRREIAPHSVAPRNITNGTGSCAIFPVQAGDVFVAVSQPHGFALELASGEREQTVTLRRFSHAEGRVTLGDGMSATGCVIRASGMRTIFPSGLTDTQRWVRRLAQRINDHVAHATSREEGRFRIPFIPMREASLRMRVSLTQDGERHSAGFLLDCDPRTELGLIEVSFAP